MDVDEAVREHMRRIGRLGGLARARRLTKERLTEIAQLGVAARKEKHPPKDSP